MRIIKKEIQNSNDKRLQKQMEKNQTKALIVIGKMKQKKKKEIQKIPNQSSHDSDAAHSELDPTSKNNNEVKNVHPIFAPQIKSQSDPLEHNLHGKHRSKDPIKNAQPEKHKVVKKNLHKKRPVQAEKLKWERKQPNQYIFFKNQSRRTEGKQ